MPLSPSRDRSRITHYSSALTYDFLQGSFVKLESEAEGKPYDGRVDLAVRHAKESAVSPTVLFRLSSPHSSEKES